MKKYFFVFIWILLANFDILSQNRINFNIGYGNYISNSENSMKIMVNKKFRSHLLFGLTYQKEDVFGYNLLIEYSYHEITEKNVIEFIRTGESSPEPIGSIGGDMTLISHNIDFNYVGVINNYFSYGIGPSLFIVNRIFEIRNIPFGEQPTSFYDKLASSGLGINGFLMFSTPITENIFFSSKIKFRYTHSIWFDEGIRNLEDYYQQFVTGQVTVGLGYLF